VFCYKEHELLREGSCGSVGQQAAGFRLPLPVSILLLTQLR
jgi:hypothetical protein